MPPQANDSRIDPSPRPSPPEEGGEGAQAPCSLICRRLSLEERYGGPADYAAKVRDAALALARDGYLLPEDVDRIGARAAAAAW